MIVVVLIGLLVYSIVHIRLIGRSAVLAAFSIVIAWLFLCQTPLYSSYFKLLSSGRWIVMGIAMALSITSAIFSRKRMWLNKWWLSPLLLVPYFLLSSEWSIDPDLTVERSISMILLWSVVFGMVWYALPSPQLVASVFKAIVLPVVCLYWSLMSAYGFNVSYVEGGLLRSSGSMNNPNASGMLGTLLLPISYYLWRTSLNERRIWFLAMLTLVFMILVSGTRGGLAATVFVVAFLIYQETKFKDAFWLMLVFLVTGGGIVLDVVGLPEIVSKYLRVDSMAILGGRWEAWQAAWDVFINRPFSGYGFGTEDQIFNYLGIQFYEHSGAMVHNSYLGLALQIGLLGVLLFFLPLLYLGVAGIRQGVALGDRQIAALAAVVVAALILSMTESWVYSAGNAQALPFWTAVGLLAGILRANDISKKIFHKIENKFAEE